MMDKDNFLLLVTKVLSGNALPDKEVLLQNTLATVLNFNHYMINTVATGNNKV